MAVDKKTFKGGMNKDVDQRLVPEDQYRNGENIRSMQGGDGTMGVITAIPGNLEKGAITNSNILNSGYDNAAFEGKTVGSVADELSRKIYFLVAQSVDPTNKDLFYDYIIEYNEITNEYAIVFQEIRGSDSILNLNVDKTIYSLDVIDSKYLCFTDNNGTPKKFNIEKSKLGIYDYNNSGVAFTDNADASTINNTDFSSLPNNLVFTFESATTFAVNDIVFVEQIPGYSYEEYNGYFTVLLVSTDSKQVLVNHEFIQDSPVIPGKMWKIQDFSGGTYSWTIDPRTHHLPEAFNNIHSHVKGQYFNAHKQGPRKKISYVYNTDSAKKKNNIFGSVWQFAYRFIYDDKEVSSLSLISDVKLSSAMGVNSSTGLNYDQANHNYVTITVPKPSDGIESLQSAQTATATSITSPIQLHGKLGIAERLNAFSSNIAAVEIYARKRNDAPFVLIEKVERYTSNETFVNSVTPQGTLAKDNYVFWDDITIDFYNDGIYPVLASRDAEKLYDYLPHKAKAQTVIDNSAILYGNVTDGFDLQTLDVSLETKYKDSDDASTPTATLNVDIPFSDFFETYVGSATFAEGGDSTFGFPDALATGAFGVQGGGASPFASNPGAALVHFGGTASDSHPRTRIMTQFDFSDIPLADDGFVKKGTVFTSSGNVKFRYKWNRLLSNKDKYGIKYEWSGITITCSNTTTNVTTFIESIRDLFRSLPDQTNPVVGNNKWRNTEVYDDGTLYDPVTKILTVHFQSKVDNGHVGDALINAKFESFAATHNTKCAILPASTSSFKTGAFHDFGIVYGNERNQTSFVNKSKDSRAYVKFLPERVTADEYDNSQANALGMPIISWEIKNSPPSWASWYQWVYAGNTSVGDFIQFTLEDVAVNLSDTNDENIYLNFNPLKGQPYSYKKQDAPIIDYVFSKNDRIRFIKNHEGVLNYYIDLPLQDAVVFNSQDDENTNFVRKFYEEKYSNSEKQDKASDGYFLILRPPNIAGWQISDIVPNTEAAPNNYKGLLFEIYSPKKQLEEGPLFYYGLTDKISIETGNAGKRYHSTNGTGTGFQDQSGTSPSTTPAKGYFTQGDIYFKGRKTIDSRDANFNLNYAVNSIEGYYANDYIDSKSYNKGRKYTYNTFAEEQERITTVFYSGPYLPSSNVNGLSEFNLIDLPFKEYSISYGQIEAAVSDSSNLILLQSNKASKVLVQKQILLGATGNANVALSDQILSEASPYQGDFGPAYAGGSVCSYGGKIYFVDPIRAVMCRLSNDGLTIISNNGMKSYFSGYLRTRTSLLPANNNSDDIYYNHISGYDAENNEYLYYGKGAARNETGQAPDYTKYPNKLVGFYEGLNKFVSFYSYNPEAIQNLGSNLYTFSKGKIYLHNQDSIKKNYNKFYGATASADSTIDVLFNGMPSVVKVYKNIGIEGTKPWTPVSLKTENFLANFHTLAGEMHATGGINYWQRKEGFYYMPTPLGSRQEFDYYEDGLSNSHVGIGTITYTSATTLTSSVDLSNIAGAGTNYLLFIDSLTIFVLISIVSIDSTGKVLTISFNTATNTNLLVVGSSYYLARNNDPNNKGIEGEKPRGVFAECSFKITPSELTYTDSDQDTIELHAMDMEVQSSPVSYK